jgi:hypothetical protein
MRVSWWWWQRALAGGPSQPAPLKKAVPVTGGGTGGGTAGGTAGVKGKGVGNSARSAKFMGKHTQQAFEKKIDSK